MAIAKLVSSKSGSQMVLSISDYRWLMKELNEITPKLSNQLRKDWRQIATPVKDRIKETIPIRPPLSGMRKQVVPGRVTWGKGKPARSAILKVADPRPKKNQFRIAQIVVGSPATVIADMAGASNKLTGKLKRTSEYAYSLSRTGFRTHKINGQGKIMIDTLNARFGSGASRMVYPGAEKALGQARDEMIDSVNEAVKMINRNLGKVRF